MFALFLKEQALKPCSGPRSRDLLHGKNKNSSVRPNLTDLVTKEGRDFHFFSDTRYMAGKTPLLRLRLTRRKKGNLKNHSFPFFFFTDSTYTSISFFPPGALDIIESCKRTDGWPPCGFCSVDGNHRNHLARWYRDRGRTLNFTQTLEPKTYAAD